MGDAKHGKTKKSLKKIKTADPNDIEGNHTSNKTKVFYSYPNNINRLRKSKEPNRFMKKVPIR